MKRLVILNFEEGMAEIYPIKFDDVNEANAREVVESLCLDPDKCQWMVTDKDIAYGTPI